LHLLHALACGVEQVHRLGEAHGDLAPDNILLRRRGLGFKVKLMDLKPGLCSEPEALVDDVQALLQIFQSVIGGNKTFVNLPPAVKALCNWRRRGNLGDRLRHAGDLRLHLESFTWT
jgi:serine/threonine protein kinase